MIRRYSLALFALLIVLLPGCKKFKKNSYNRKSFIFSKVFFAGPLPDGPVTLFIHGTKSSVISKMVHKLDYPLGIVPSSINTTGSVLDRIAHTLSQTDPVQFDRDTFYFYGWAGKLTFKSRFRASERLYSVICNHQEPMTIITHSHGCNVALNLAYWAEQNENTSFKIDRLILLAPPVQEVTKGYAHSPVFKEIYTLYSTADLMQVGDPQGLYRESYDLTPPNTPIPLFSKRTFEPGRHIIQIRILLDRQSPGHLHFMLPRFVKHIPAVLKLAKEASERMDFKETGNCFTVNIPLCGLPPHLVKDEEIKNKYIPRSSYHQSRRRALALKQGQPAKA